MGIGIITRGDVSIKWMTHMDKLKGHFPIGMFWKYIIVEGLSWAEARNEVVRQARKENFEYLLFIDDDVFLPEDAVKKMFSHQKDIINGIYWVKTDIDNPVIFKEFGAGPYINFPMDEVFEIAGSGLGCALIKMDVFDKFDEAGIYPYFKENWVMTTDSGQNMKCPIGEDHYFFYHAGKVGYKVWADSSILCDHYDMKNKVMYPRENVVRKYIEKKLKKDGRQDLIDDYKMKAGHDADRPTVVFISSDSFAGDSIEKGPLGGTETSVINVSRQLAKKYNTHVFCNTLSPGIYDNVIYSRLQDLERIKDLNGVDSVIVVRNTNIINDINFKKDYSAKNVLLWAHDIADSPANAKLEESYKKIDKIVVLTKWHKSNYMEKFEFLKDDDFVIAPHGVDMKMINSPTDPIKKTNTLVYSSTPYRGLDVLAELFPDIKKQVPDAKLEVYSSMTVYGDKFKSAEDEWQWLYRKLKGMEGVNYHGSVPKKTLYAKFIKDGDILAYPNTYPETFCITAIEAMATGMPIVTSDYAGLKNVVTDDVGIKIKGNPHSKEYKKAFVDAVVKLLTDNTEYNKLRDACLDKDVSWSTAVNVWDNFLFSDSDSIQKNGNINTPKYWDAVYSNEITRGTDIRLDEPRYKMIFDEVNKKHKNPTILDVGCGTGEFTRAVRKHYPESEIWGSDFSMVAIDYCRSKNKTIHYANHPMLSDDFEEDYFDVVSCQHVIEHIEHPEKMVDRMVKLVKKDGTLIIVIPINDNEWREHYKIWQVEDVDALISKYTNNYKIELHTVEERKYKDGRPFQEAIVYAYEVK